MHTNVIHNNNSFIILAIVDGKVVKSIYSTLLMCLCMVKSAGVLHGNSQSA